MYEGRRLAWAAVTAVVVCCGLPPAAHAQIWDDLWPLAKESASAGQWADCLDNVQICYDNAPRGRKGEAAALGARCAAGKGDGAGYDLWAKRAGGALKASDRAALEAKLGRAPAEKPVAKPAGKPAERSAEKPIEKAPKAAPPKDAKAAIAEALDEPVEPSEPADPEAALHPDMVKVSGGEFWMGCNDRQDPDCRDDEKPGRRERVDAFWLDRHEVTVAEYAACMASGKCTEPRKGGSCTWGQLERNDYPITCVGRDQARAYCQFAGKRLPSEAQWEKAARSIDARRFPWGNGPLNCVMAVWGDGPNPDGCGANGPKPVCSAKAGNASCDACDLAGNVYEWVDDPFTAYDPATNTWKPTADGLGVIRGGSWFNGDAADLRTSARVRYDPAKANGALGFRCVTDAAK